MLMIYYKGHRSVYFEEKTEELARAFKGSLKSAFEFSDGLWGANASFPTQAQEDTFREHLTSMSKHLDIEVSFGGFVQL